MYMILSFNNLGLLLKIKTIVNDINNDMIITNNNSSDSNKDDGFQIETYRQADVVVSVSKTFLIQVCFFIIHSIDVLLALATELCVW